MARQGADARTRRVLIGLLGAPIASSASPALHEAAARAAGIEAFYHLIEVAGADKARLRAILDGVRQVGFAGINVTFPYKEAVVELLDDLAPVAKAMGAVNTVVVRDGRLIGHNTDTTGFRTAYDRLIAASGPKAAPATVAVIGAGGVGRAIAFALAHKGGPRLRLFDQDRAKAEDLAGRLGRSARVAVAGSIEAALDGTDGIVNATPLGMAPDNRSPVPAALISAGHVVVDVVYSPLFTPLLTEAHRRGARIMTGRDLVIHQALDGFRLFTGLEGSESAMSGAFDRVMAARATSPLTASIHAETKAG
ncbi:shikimate dehydrogenase [Phreatobacter stygius]|uniref:Shikimate dehydrogenase (NADP(+)) n=1 Tax=Phreatobacter stygius TaxID=1940610 RepID=A0A4D7BHA8_9HYPH|nr:shikimate dehydrogenase [Phreatobacter stygius]QCI67187.1 shikimate dehydrogenase [Phreatobacter stygius]